MITGVTGQLDGAAIHEGGNFDAKPVLRVGGRNCQCAVCGEYFSGVATFDRHLVGTSKCRTPDEMYALGMLQNQFSVWCGGFGVTSRISEGAGVKWA